MSEKIIGEKNCLAVLMESDASDSEDEEIQPSNFFNFEDDNYEAPKIRKSNLTRIETEQDDGANIDEDLIEADEIYCENVVEADHIQNATLLADCEWVSTEIEIEFIDHTMADFNMQLTNKNQVQWRRRPEFIKSETPYENSIRQESVEVGTPMFYFKKYFTEELFQLMADNTNMDA